MKTKKIRIDDYFHRRLKDPAFRQTFFLQQQALELGTEIARMRRELGFSQSQLADLVGMVKQNISRLEKARYANFTLDTLQRIASAFGRRVEVKFVKSEPRS